MFHVCLEVRLILFRPISGEVVEDREHLGTFHVANIQSTNKVSCCRDMTSFWGIMATKAISVRVCLSACLLAGCLSIYLPIYLLRGGLHFSSGHCGCWSMPGYVRYRRTLPITMLIERIMMITTSSRKTHLYQFCTMFCWLLVGLKGEMPQDERVLCLAQDRGLSGARKVDNFWMISWIAGNLSDIFHCYSIYSHISPYIHISPCISICISIYIYIFPYKFPYMSIALSIFPECVARVPVSLWGCGGWAVFAGRCVCGRNRLQPSATVRNSSQPSATVRNRSREDRMAVPMVSSCKFCKRGHFWKFFCVA